MTDHGCILVGLLPFGAFELRERNREQSVGSSMLMHGRASSEVVPVVESRAQTCWTEAWKKRIGSAAEQLHLLSNRLERLRRVGLR